jgi:hypothetical protein
LRGEIAVRANCFHSGLAGYRRSLDGGFHTQFTVHRAIMALSSMTELLHRPVNLNAHFKQRHDVNTIVCFREWAAPLLTKLPIDLL